MELFQLRCFLAVANRENISKAAEDIYMSQPALSKVISRLEKEVGVPLFSRTKSSITLNANGLLFQKYVSESMNVLDEGLGLLQKEAEASKNRIRISYQGPLTLMEILEECQTVLPQCRLEMKSVLQKQALQCLDLEEAELCIVTSASPVEDIRFEAIAKQNWVAALTESHRSFGKQQMSAEDFAGEIVCFSGSDVDRRFVETCMTANQIHPQKFCIQADAKETAKLINQGSAIGIMEDDAFYHRKRSSPRIPLHALPMEGDWSRTIYMGKATKLSGYGETAYEVVKTHILEERHDIDNFLARES